MRRYSGDASLSRRAEASATKLAGVHQPDEERVERVVLAPARLTEAPHGVFSQRAVHHQSLRQDRAPLIGQILGMDGVKARSPEQRAVAMQGLQGDRGHPFVESRALEIAQGGVREP